MKWLSVHGMTFGVAMISGLIVGAIVGLGEKRFDAFWKTAAVIAVFAYAGGNLH